MAKEMLINVSEGEECRIALVEDGKLEELYMERTSATSHVNNIYKGRVMNVEPSIQAAFIDFGLGRNGFLHISDLMPTYFGQKGEDIQESVGRKMARRDRPPIQRCLRRGDEVLVQVIKEGIGTKGPTLSTYLSIPGKILVMMPGMASKGVSRKIEDDDERRRLRQILDALNPPDDVGFIIRTAGVGKSKLEIERDLKYLVRLWEIIKKKRDGGQGPVELYTEGDLVTRTVRDLFTSDVDHLVIDNREVAQRVDEVIRLSNPRAKNRVDLYEDPIPLFHKYGIEKEIEQMYSRHVPLPSGGSLVIDSTEAIVAIDVNHSKFRDHSAAETTAYKIDMEAADEICRQLKLCDLGGVIICDFIDLRYERHRTDLENRLNENLKRDRAKTKVLRMSQFGIVEMTRQRMRPSYKRSVYFDCPHCKGAGLVKTHESMSLDVMRRLAIGINDARVVRVELAVNPDVASYLLNKRRQQLACLEYDYNKSISIKSDPALGLDEMKLELFANREGTVVLPNLLPASVPHTTQLRTKPQLAPPPRGGRPGAHADDRRPTGRGAQPQPRHRDEEPDDQHDWEHSADELEDRSEHMDRDAEETGAPSPDVTAARPPQQRDRQDQRPAAPGRAQTPGRGFDGRASGSGRAPDPRRAPAPGRGPNPGRAPAQSGGRGPANGAPAGNADDNEQMEGDGPRRRRRRRRRGRGRNGQAAEQNAQPTRNSANGPDERERPFDANDDSRPRDDNRAPIQEHDRSDAYDAGADNERDREPQRDRENEYDPALDRAEAVAEDRGSGADVRDETARDDMARDEMAPEAISHGAHAADRDEQTLVSPDREPLALQDTPDSQAGHEAQAPSDEAKGPGKSRRRGSRGRGRGRAKAKDADLFDESGTDEKGGDASTDSLAPAPAQTPSDDTPSRRKTKAKPRRAAAGAKATGAKAGSARAGKPRGKGRAAAQAATHEAPAAKIAAPVARTGSADKHLVDEEPVDHEPVRRPRSYRAVSYTHLTL